MGVEEDLGAVMQTHSFRLFRTSLATVIGCSPATLVHGYMLAEFALDRSETLCPPGASYAKRAELGDGNALTGRVQFPR